MQFIIVPCGSLPILRTPYLVRGIQHEGQRSLEDCLHFVGIGTKIEISRDDHDNGRHVKASDCAIAIRQTDKGKTKVVNCAMLTGFQ